jgi:hypothetical protein
MEVNVNAKELFSKNLPLVGYVSRKFGKTPFLSCHEKNSFLMEGLFNAALRYDPNKGAFSTYAIPAMINTLKCGLRRTENTKFNDKMLSLDQFVEYCPIHLATNPIAIEEPIPEGDMVDTVKEFRRLKYLGTKIQQKVISNTANGINLSHSAIELSVTRQSAHQTLHGIIKKLRTVAQKDKKRVKNKTHTRKLKNLNN